MVPFFSTWRSLDVDPFVRLASTLATPRATSRRRPTLVLSFKQPVPNPLGLESTERPPEARGSPRGILFGSVCWCKLHHPPRRKIGLSPPVPQVIGGPENTGDTLTTQSASPSHGGSTPAQCTRSRRAYPSFPHPSKCSQTSTTKHIANNVGRPVAPAEHMASPGDRS